MSNALTKVAVDNFTATPTQTTVPSVTPTKTATLVPTNTPTSTVTNTTTPTKVATIKPKSKKNSLYKTCQKLVGWLNNATDGNSTEAQRIAGWERYVNLNCQSILYGIP